MDSRDLLQLRHRRSISERRFVERVAELFEILVMLPPARQPIDEPRDDRIAGAVSDNGWYILDLAGEYCRKADRRETFGADERWPQGDCSLPRR